MTPNEALPLDTVLAALTRAADMIHSEFAHSADPDPSAFLEEARAALLSEREQLAGEVDRLREELAEQRLATHKQSENVLAQVAYGEQQRQRAEAAEAARDAYKAADESMQEAHAAAQNELYELRAKLAAQGEALAGWRPIADAPQGAILLMCDMNAAEARNWAYVDWVVGGKCFGNRAHTPTHWHPLPAPPEQSA